ncbi:MAG: NAD-dependent epimerase/dehydratase family protein [Elusimicrobia bacterium]|nr:NAD-dependent epimerase/dehydratase family protein [Elusimicrobiota bacterium]
MKKILILGINGFTGKYLQKYIVKNNLRKKYLFIGVDKKIDKQIAIKYIVRDLLVDQSLEKIIVSVKPDYIVNLAGILKSNDPLKAIEINANLSLRIFETIVKNKLIVKKILIIGSAAEYGKPKYLPVDETHELNPLNCYGLSKVIQTQYANYYHHNFGLNVNIARTFNLIGEGMPDLLVFGSFVKQISNAKDGDKIYVGNLGSKRDFVDVKYAVEVYWKILLNGKAGEIYNVCSGKSIRIRDIVLDLLKKSEKKLKLSIDKSRIYKNDVPNIYGDNSFLKRQLGIK